MEGLTDMNAEIKEEQDRESRHTDYDSWYDDNRRWLNQEFADEHPDEFEAFCRQQYKDKGD